MRMILCATNRRLRSRPVASVRMPSRTSLLILRRAVRAVTLRVFHDLRDGKDGVLEKFVEQTEGRKERRTALEFSM